MSYRRMSQIALVVLTGVLLACGADQAGSPTQPDLGGLASGSGEMGKPPDKDKPPHESEIIYTDIELSGGFVTSMSFPVDRQETKKGILKIGGGREVDFLTKLRLS